MTKRNGSGTSVVRALFVTLWVSGGWISAVHAQANPNQFGGQDRADAASTMIVLGVQQGISSLPPTSGQSFTYEFDPALATMVASDRLGPTSFRVPQTIGNGKYSFRVATSYFELADSFASIPYQVNSSSGTPIGVGKLGLRANAHVGLINLAMNHGFTERFEMSINVPVVVVDAHANSIFTTADGVSFQGPGFHESIGQTLRDLDTVLHNGQLKFGEKSFTSLGFRFNSENHLGIGRISVGAKGLLFANQVVQLAFAPEVFLPSPSEKSFAGSETGAILPRVVAAFPLMDTLKLHMDAGYDYDFEVEELRRFVWDAGASVPLRFATFDFGVGGSKFNKGIAWTPRTAPFVNKTGQSGTIVALGDNQLGDNFIDAIAGVKFRVTNTSVISGSVNVPLNNEGFRAAAVGTAALEVYF